jgi:hypothetical protein
MPRLDPRRSLGPAAGSTQDACRVSRSQFWRLAAAGARIAPATASVSATVAPLLLVAFVDRGCAIATRRGASAPQPQRLLLRVGRNSRVSTAINPRHASCVRVAMTNPRRLLERDFERHLRYGRTVHAPPIIVSANPDAASLLDAIDLHGETRPAWETASRVGSAATSAQDATVKRFTEHIRKHSPATELAVSSQALGPTRIGLSVHDGSVTLEGQITWNYRRDAERAIQYLSNAIGVRALKRQCSTSYVKDNVEGALRWLPMDTSEE